MTLNLSNPSSSTISRQSGTGRINDASSPPPAPLDIAISVFYTDGARLLIDYTVSGTVLTPFKIGVYASPDRLVLVKELEIANGNTPPGIHTLSISPTFTDPRGGYYLVAVVDSQEAVAEANETNNAAFFNGGSFVVHEAESDKWIVHAHGTDQADSVTLRMYGTWLDVTVERRLATPAGAIAPPPFYDVTGEDLLGMVDSQTIGFNRTNSTKNWQNQANRMDVNNDGFVSPIDALLAMNFLSAWGTRLLSAPRGTTYANSFLDVNGDNVLSVVDSNLVMDYLNDFTFDNPETPDWEGPPPNSTLERNYLWRNEPKPLDANNSGSVTAQDEEIIIAQLPRGYGRMIEYATIGPDDYGTIGIDEVHIRAHGGNDVANSRSYIDIPLWMYGGYGNDILTGGGASDIILGGPGDDELSADKGDDEVSGNAGDDDVDGGDGDDTVGGGTGDDTVSGGEDDDDVFGGPGGDDLDGGDGDDDPTDDGNDNVEEEEDAPTDECGSSYVSGGTTVQDPSNPDQNVTYYGPTLLGDDCEGEADDSDESEEGEEGEEEDAGEGQTPVDLDIDSNNNGSITAADDSVEDITGEDARPGQIILVSNTDTDDDGLLDWVDGFDWREGVYDDNASPGTSFEPLKLTLPDGVDFGSVKIEFTYDDTDPALYASANLMGKQFLHPTDGALRIWAKDSSDARDPRGVNNGGDFIKSATSYTGAQLGIDERTTTFYIEAVNPSQSTAEKAINVKVSGGKIVPGTTLEDRVRVTTTMIQIMATTGAPGEEPIEVDGFAASRLPQYDPYSDEPGFNDWRQYYVIRVFDPRSNLNHITLAEQNLSLGGIGSAAYATQPFIMIRDEEQSLLAADALVDFRTEVADDQGNPLPDAVTYAQWPSDITGGTRVITMSDGVRPVVQYVGVEQEGKWIVFSELATGKDKTIADLVNKAMEELGPNWTATNPIDSGAYGKAVHAKVSERMANFWNWPIGEAEQWKSGMLVNWRTRRIEQLSGATQGIGDLTELDVVYLESGYEPQVGQTLDPSKVIIYEVKTSATGIIDPNQLARLKAIQGAEVRQIWSQLKWQQTTNTLVENKRYTNALGLARLRLKQKMVLGAAGGVFVVLTSADQAYASFEQEVINLADYHVSGKSDFEKAQQEGAVKVAFKNLLDGFTGGTSDEITGWMLIDHVYKKLIPSILNP